MDAKLGDEERKRVLNFCNKYLDGVWKTVSTNEIDITRVSGGMSNLLFRCVLDDSVVTTPIDGNSKNEPRQVLLRIYGRSQGDIKTQLEIFNQLAGENLGPKLYSTFPEGRFEEYLPSSPLTWQELTDDSISSTIAKQIAAIHSLNVNSLNENSQSQSWLLNKYHHYSRFIESYRNNPIKFNGNTLESTKKIASELMAIDFKKEIDFLEELLNKSAEPLVFSHNDLHQNNIILLHDAKLSLKDRIVLIDFEYCSLNYRPFDIANHLSEWCFDYNGNDKYPYFNASVDRFPSEDRQKKFIGQYLSELEKGQNGQCFDTHKLQEILNGNNNHHHDDPTILSDNKVEQLYQQTQPFHMASNFLWCIWAIKGAHTSAIEFGYWEMAKYKWDIYMFSKQKYLHNSRANNSYNDDGDKNRAGLQAARM